MIGRFTIRQIAEEREATLSPHAVQSRFSRGRVRPEEPCPIRTAFQRDRDRIVYSKAFRRLKHKTQVFISPRGDHYVTRLTHTLEVSQIARTIARALNLNEDLTEAIAMGHDLGHTPFGHVGEEVLDNLYRGGFRHNEQSLRVVDIIENDGRGLNLTWEVRDGIINHSKSGAGILRDWGEVGTLEGEICRISDAVAYINHDIDDAIRADVISAEDLPSSALHVLGDTLSRRVNTLVGDIIEQSWGARGGGTGRPVIGMSAGVQAAAEEMRAFLFEKVYNVNALREETARARDALRLLYGYYNRHDDELPPEYALFSEEKERRVVDYIAGMTDQYATQKAAEIAG